MERRPAAIFLLVVEWGTYGDVCPQSAARWSHADLGIGRARLLVRPQQRVFANAADAKPPLDASSRRYHLFSRSRGLGALCRRPQDRPLFQEERLMSIQHA